MAAFSKEQLNVIKNSPMPLWYLVALKEQGLDALYQQAYSALSTEQKQQVDAQLRQYDQAPDSTPDGATARSRALLELFTGGPAQYAPAEQVQQRAEDPLTFMSEDQRYDAAQRHNVGQWISDKVDTPFGAFLHRYSPQVRVLSAIADKAASDPIAAQAAQQQQTQFAQQGQQQQGQQPQQPQQQVSPYDVPYVPYDPEIGKPYRGKDGEWVWTDAQLVHYAKSITADAQKALLSELSTKRDTYVPGTNQRRYETVPSDMQASAQQNYAELMQKQTNNLGKLMY